MKSILELKNGWNAVRDLISTAEDKDVAFYQPTELKNLVLRLDSLFIETILKHLNQNQTDEIFKNLLQIRDIFSKRAFFASRDVSKLNENDINEIIKNLKSINDEFSQIENIESLINSYLSSKAIFQELEDKFRGQARELFGELTTESIHKPYNDEYNNFKLLLRIKLISFWLLIFFMFWVLGSLTGVINCKLFFINNFNEKETLHSLISHFSMLIPLVWSILFLGKRINEDKKLQQTYLHKTVIAKSLSNYLDYIGEKINDDEMAKEIRQKLFLVSIEALGINPALLLDKNTAEKIPMEDILSKVIDKVK